MKNNNRKKKSVVGWGWVCERDIWLTEKRLHEIHGCEDDFTESSSPKSKQPLPNNMGIHAYYLYTTWKHGFNYQNLPMILENTSKA